MRTACHRTLRGHRATSQSGVGTQRDVIAVGLHAAGGDATTINRSASTRIGDHACRINRACKSGRSCTIERQCAQHAICCTSRIAGESDATRTRARSQTVRLQRCRIDGTGKQNSAVSRC